MRLTTHPIVDPVHAHFLALLPGLHRYAHATCRYRDPNQRDDYIAEAVAAGYVNCRSLVHRGRVEQAHTPGFIAHAVHAVKNGRHVGTAMASRDVMTERGRFRHGRRVYSFCGMCEEQVSPSNRFPLSFEQILADPRTPVPDQAAFRIDFGGWLSRLSPRDQLMIERLAAGDRPGEVARQMQVSPVVVSQRRAKWCRSWRRLMGEGATS
ncbi:MAG: hypothetical protein WD042_12110 [Phycisphaeraceae bacterium]